MFKLIFLVQSGAKNPNIALKRFAFFSILLLARFFILIYASEYFIAEQVKYLRLMDSHLSYINDIAAEENRTRETKKEQRRNNYKHCIHLPKNINHFKKKKMKQLKITAAERS